MAHAWNLAETETGGVLETNGAVFSSAFHLPAL